MLFNSFGFIFLFLPVCLGIASRLKGKKLLVWITFCSFFFYAFVGHVWFLLPMAFTTALDFFLAPLIHRATDKSKRARLLVVSLCGNLGLLFYFKYAGLLWRTFSVMAPSAMQGSFFQVVLPAGISFYTFQTLSYVIDVYRGDAEPESSFWRFASFVTFFPHLIAGPLTRHDQLIPGLKEIEKAGIRPKWQAGVFLFVIGLAKKVLIADRIADLIDPLIADISHAGFAASWIAILGYALQIYFDFSGYSDMAIGLGRLFGIELPKNFNSPYQSLNPSEFWRRWHMTLSRWLRDYLYIPLGGNRCSSARTNFNLLATMVLGGLWHGASWTFAIWGLMHGLLLMLYHRYQNGWDRMPAALQRALTFLLVCFAWVFFRATSFSQAKDWFCGLLGLRGVGGAVVGSLSLAALLLIPVGLGIASLLPNASHSNELAKLGTARQIALGTLAVATILFMNYSSRFLYFQF